MDKRVHHKILQSFSLWLDHQLLSKATAYTNTTSQLYPYPTTSGDSKYGTDFAFYGSPHYQWVNDVSITGANVPSGVTTNSGVYNRGDHGLVIDYHNGRVLMDNDQTGLTVSGSYARKDFNIYMTTKFDQKLIFETRHKPNDSKADNTFAPPYNTMTPAIFIRGGNKMNKRHSYGGKYETIINLRCVFFAESDYKLWGAQAVLEDAVDLVFPYFDTGPVNYYGDIKTPPYNYTGLSAANNTQDRLVYIESVESTPIESDKFEEAHPGFKLGVGDVRLKFYGYPHQR